MLFSSLMFSSMLLEAKELFSYEHLCYNCLGQGIIVLLLGYISSTNVTACCLMGVVFLLSSVYMTRFSYAKYSAQCHNGVVITANIGVKLQYFSTIHAHLCNICVSNQQSYE